MDLTTGAMTALVDDPRGGVRDPQVHYDGHKILFSYRPNDEPHYHLYEINADGILPPNLQPNQPIDVYATDRSFWQSHWHRAHGQSPPVAWLSEPRLVACSTINRRSDPA